MVHTEGTVARVQAGDPLSNRVRDAYGARVAEYVDAVGLIEHADPVDRAALLCWASSVTGPVLDVGCGAGQWTNLFHEAGIDVTGIEPVPGFIAEARRRYPAVRFSSGSAEALPVPDGSLGGILAWFSLIHTDPAELHAPLLECARALRPGGTLALGFFVGDDGVPFDHAVTTAFWWSLDALAKRLESTGFCVISADARTDPGARPVGTVVAQRNPAAPPLG